MDSCKKFSRSPQQALRRYALSALAFLICNDVFGRLLWLVSDHYGHVWLAWCAEAGLTMTSACVIDVYRRLG